MLGAVSFDDQVMFKTSEVGDVSADRMLTPKVDTEFPVAQRPPQQRLSISRIVTHPSGEGALPLWYRVLGHPIRVSGLGVRVNPPTSSLCLLTPPRGESVRKQSRGALIVQSVS